MPALLAGDLRSDAKDRQRVKNHNAKWARGALPAVGKKCTHIDPNAAYGFVGGSETCDACARRPAGSRPGFSGMHGARDRRPRAERMIQSSMRADFTEAADDGARGFGRGYAKHGPEPDADVMYSFEAQAGPSHGSQILNYAVLQAVERFENKETEKIVKEYDLVADGRDDDMEFADADDDFELVDSSYIK